MTQSPAALTMLLSRHTRRRELDTVIFARTLSLGLTVQNRATHPIGFEQREAAGASSPLTHRWRGQSAANSSLKTS